MFSLDENQRPVDDGVVVPEPVIEPTTGVAPDLPDPAPVSEPAVTVAPEPPANDSSSPVADSDLAELQKQAINELAPILGKLDLSNEEKFNTTMMMVQATDNQALLRDAHEAAKAIEDEKARAQALLDIINEINFFTAKPE